MTDYKATINGYPASARAPTYTGGPRIITLTIGPVELELSDDEADDLVYILGAAREAMRRTEKVPA